MTSDVVAVRVLVADISCGCVLNATRVQVTT